MPVMYMHSHPLSRASLAPGTDPKLWLCLKTCKSRQGVCNNIYAVLRKRAWTAGHGCRCMAAISNTAGDKDVSCQTMKIQTALPSLFICVVIAWLFAYMHRGPAGMRRGSSLPC